MHFPFLELPLELREWIYEYALVPDNNVLRVSWDYWTPNSTIEGSFWGSEDTTMSLFHVCKSVYEEARKVFYNQVKLSFTGWSPQESWPEETPKGWTVEEVVLTFLQSRPDESLRHIQRMDISVPWDDNMVVRPRDPDAESLFNGKWSEICTILAHKCTIQHFNLTVDPVADPYGDRIPIETDILAAWAAKVSQINGLHSLTVYVAWYHMWELEKETRDLVLGTLMHMRNTMLERSHDLGANSGLGLRLRAKELGYSGYLFSAELEIDRYGRSSIGPEKRVEILPYLRCTHCGCFVGREWTECSCGHHFASWLSCTTASEGKCQDGKRWGSKPVVEYLPKGVTMTDFLQAQAYLDAGFAIGLEGVFDDCSLEAV